jgi:hypothetical protein
MAKTLGIRVETARCIPPAASKQLEETAVDQAQDLRPQTIFFDDLRVGSELLQGARGHCFDRHGQ